MSLKAGTGQACAACKYQRKRCTPDCALAPHFRPEQAEIFKNAHKLFGVRNILRILEEIDPAQKNEAMRSIIYEANMRDRFPVHGCLGIIYQLQYDIRQAEEELYTVLCRLASYKQCRQQKGQVVGPPKLHQFQLGMANDTQESVVPVASLPISSSYTNSEEGKGKASYNNSEVYIHPKDSANWPQQTYCSRDNDDKALMSLQSQLLNSHPVTIQAVGHDYEEIYRFFDPIDDRQSYIESKDANESSSESSLKDSIQSLHHVAVKELKRAKLQLGIISEEYQSVV